MTAKNGELGKRVMCSVLGLGLMAAAFIACHNAEYEIIDTKAKSGPPQGFGPGGEFVDTFRANQYQPLEIFFAVDTSSSLTQERQMLQNNIKTFMDSFSPAGFPSVRINIIGNSSTYDAADCPRTNGFQFPAGASNLRMIDLCIGSYNMISRLTQYFHGAPQLMDGAGVEVIMVSDDNGQGPGNLAKDFDPRVGTRSMRISAVVGLPGVTQPTAGCRVAMYGLEAIELAKETGGRTYNICDPDWATLMKDMAQDIQSSNAGYLLKGVVDTTKPIQVTVDGTIMPQNAYTIDQATHMLRFNANYPMQTGATIVVHYFIVQ